MVNCFSSHRARQVCTHTHTHTRIHTRTQTRTHFIGEVFGPGSVAVWAAISGEG